ncbi:MAG: putative membrane protein YedE/YeeE [Granulosicoccus sp.]|jgi:uncharacterized membrane protein YedE/YeeE
MIEFISQPWHWTISGAMISLVMLLLIYLGQKFGVSSSFQAMCSIGGAGNRFEYFNYDWKKHDWLLVFVLGSIIGGGIASTLLASPDPVQISAATINDLSALGITYPTTNAAGAGFLPLDVFNFAALKSLQGIILIVLGGFFIGFGTRYAGGCTSGHAITGLSNLQLPSLVAVVGFFIGGLVMTHLLFPIIFSL